MTPRQMDKLIKDGREVNFIDTFYGERFAGVPVNRKGGKVYIMINGRGSQMYISILEVDEQSS